VSEANDREQDGTRIDERNVTEELRLAPNDLATRGDQALKSRAQDSLNRTPFANALAQQIVSTDASQEVVFGLVGSWGSGKTSLLNMTAEALRAGGEPRRRGARRRSRYHWRRQAQAHVDVSASRAGAHAVALLLRLIMPLPIVLG
jgi:ABC-type glutathione transport system ATPase component